MIWVPNQLVGAPVGTDVTIDCHTEAHPKWVLLLYCPFMQYLKRTARKRAMGGLFEMKYNIFFELFLVLCELATRLFDTFLTFYKLFYVSYNFCLCEDVVFFSTFRDFKLRGWVEERKVILSEEAWKNELVRRILDPIAISQGLLRLLKGSTAISIINRMD